MIQLLIKFRDLLIAALGLGTGMVLLSVGAITTSLTETQAKSAIETLQNNYIQTHPHYWQGLITHSVIPDGSIETDADLLNKKTEYQTESWINEGINNVKTSYALEIHQYTAPQGKGYQIFFWRNNAGQLQNKSIGYGPEATERTFDWKNWPIKL